ncbi:MAG: tetratricopeptide repeat protein, partial [Aphanizomenon sp.]
MIIFCGGTAKDLRSLGYNLCQTLLTQIDKSNIQGTICNTASEIDAYFQLLQPSSPVTLIQYQIPSKLTLEKIQHGEVKSIYLHQDPREILAAVLASLEQKLTFESTFINLWQQYQEKWFSDSHQTLLIRREKLISEPHSEISKLATYLNIEFTESEIDLLLKQYQLPSPETVGQWTEILSSEQCLIIETLLKPLLLQFNDEDEFSISERLEQHLAAIQLEQLIIQIDKIIGQFSQIKTEIRKQFYESIDQYLVTVLTAIGRLHEAGEVCHLLGTALTLQNDLQLAEKWYLRALNIQPQLAKSHYNLGFVYEQEDDWEKAIVHYNHAITINDNYTKAYYRLGLIFKRQKQFTQAIEQFSQVLHLDPKHQGAKFNLALLWQQGESADFIQNLLGETDLELLPHLTEEINDTGAILVRERQWEQAKIYFKLVIELDPDCVLAHYNLGCVLQNQNRYPEAITSYRRSLKINANYIDSLKNLGYVYYKNGQADLAQECFQKILQLNPNHSETYELLGFIAGEQGKLSECI